MLLLYPWLFMCIVLTPYKTKLVEFNACPNTHLCMQQPLTLMMRGVIEENV